MRNDPTTNHLSRCYADFGPIYENNVPVVASARSRERPSTPPILKNDRRPSQRHIYGLSTSECVRVFRWGGVRALWAPAFAHHRPLAFSQQRPTDDDGYDDDAKGATTNELFDYAFNEAHSNCVSLCGSCVSNTRNLHHEGWFCNLRVWHLSGRTHLRHTFPYAVLHSRWCMCW